MRQLITILLLFSGIMSVQADNFYPNSNPFPQTVPQTMNNIYESEPAVMQEEAKKAKKSYTHKIKNTQNDINEGQHKIPVYPVYNEGLKSEENFYMFTTGE